MNIQTTGLKSVDQLIHKYGISAFAESTPFLKRKQLTVCDAREVGMPFCFFQHLKNLDENDYTWCFTAYIPNKKQRLAMYLVNSNNIIIEQVYLCKDRRRVLACKKIQALLTDSLHLARSHSYTLAA